MGSSAVDLEAGQKYFSSKASRFALSQPLQFLILGALLKPSRKVRYWPIGESVVQRVAFCTFYLYMGQPIHK